MEQKAIEQAIQSVRDFYEQQGIFMKPFGFGAKPTLLIIDTAYGWTDLEHATSSQRLDEAVTGINRLLLVCRYAGIPIIYTTYPAPRNGEEPMHATDKAWTRFTPLDPHACEIDDGLAPYSEDLIIYKENASAFFGTALATYLTGHEPEEGIGKIHTLGTVHAGRWPYSPSLPRRRGDPDVALRVL